MCEDACEGEGEGVKMTEWKRQGVRRREAYVRDRAPKCEDERVGNCGEGRRESGLLHKKKQGSVWAGAQSEDVEGEYECDVVRKNG